MESLDPQSTFEDMRNVLDKKLDNWQEFYSLIEKVTKKEISTIDIYDSVVRTGKESEATNVIFVCKPKFTFVVTKETFERYETDEGDKLEIPQENTPLQANTFSFGYFGASETPFAEFIIKIKKRFSHFEEKFEVMFGGDIIDDDRSFNDMISNVKDKNESKIFVTLKIKV